MADDGQRHNTLPTREQILDGAFRLFATEGIRQTTLADVALEVGVQEADVRRHFDEVDALLMGVLEWVDSSFVDAEIHMAGAPWSSEESVRRLSAGAEVLAERPLLARLRVVVSFEAIVRDGAARRYVQERTEAIRWWFSQILLEGIRRGEFAPDLDPDSRAAEIFAFMEGIQIQWLLHPERIDLVAAYESYLDDLLEQIMVES